MTHVAIIGNGIAGITAARRLRELRPDWSITVISGESTHHYSRPALMYIFMGHMRYAETKPYADGDWERWNIALVRDWVVDVDVDANQLTLHRGAPINYDHLIIATGSTPNRFGWPGQDLPGVQGLYSLIDLHQLYDNASHARHATVVGGGLIGIELGEMLHSRGIDVTFLVRESSYWNNVLPNEESAMVNRLIREAGFELRLESELKEILPDASGRVGSIVTSDGDTLETQLVGLTAGVSPNIDLVRDSAIETGRGVLVDDQLRTNIPNVYAAGDCAEIRRPGDERNLLQQVWYTGKLQGAHLASVIAGETESAYDPGTWYNSAKFLDLEYQTYGTVLPRPPEHHVQHWFEDDDGRRGMRLVSDRSTGALLGVNLMGMRGRHRVFEEWIRESRPLTEVLDHLGDADFDPEFTRRFLSNARVAVASGGAS